MPAIFPGFRSHCCALHPWEPSICRRAGRTCFPRQCWNEDLLDEPQSSLLEMSQEELSGSVSQLEVSLSNYYNSRVIFAAERRCYRELWQTHWVLQQRWQTNGNEFRKDAWGMLSQSLPLPLASHHSLSLALRHEAGAGIEDLCTHKHIFYLCRVAHEGMAMGRFFISVKNAEYWVDWNWKMGQEARLAFSWIHQRTISTDMWNPQRFAANQPTNEKTHMWPKEWLQLRFLGFETVFQAMLRKSCG